MKICKYCNEIEIPGWADCCQDCGIKDRPQEYRLKMNNAKCKLEPYEAFENWLKQNGFNDILECPSENINLNRLHEAIELYQNS